MEHDAKDFKLAIEDITIISLLSQGTRQKDIPDYLKQHHIKPSGLSSVEKRLNLIKEELEFSNNE